MRLAVSSSQPLFVVAIDRQLADTDVVIWGADNKTIRFRGEAVEPTSSATIAGLFAAFETLLATGMGTLPQPRVSLYTLTLKPAGVGGLVGLNDDQSAELFGRRAEATVAVAVRAPTTAELPGAVATALESLLGIGRAALDDVGLLRLELERVGPPAAARPQSTEASQELHFVAHYELVSSPLEGDEVIANIPIELVAADG